MTVPVTLGVPIVTEKDSDHHGTGTPVTMILAGGGTARDSSTDCFPLVLPENLSHVSTSPSLVGPATSPHMDTNKPVKKS